MITLTAPVAADRLYADRTVTIAWTDTTSQTVSIFLSLDGGSSYDPTPIFAGVSSSAGANSVSWTPAAANDSARLKVVSDPNPGTDFSESDVLQVRTVSLNVQGPSGTMNPLGIPLNGYCNIVWDAGGTAEVQSVEIHLSTDDGVTWPLTISGSAPNTGQFVWTVSSLLSTAQGSCRVRVRSLATGDASNWSMSPSAFAVQSADLAGYPTDFDYPESFATFARISGLKAEQDHEATMRGQFEAGTGITITHRGETGAANRRNIVIATERAVPRMLSGEVLCQTSAGDGYTAASGKYGDHLTGEIIHGWSLANPWAIQASFENIPEAAETLEGIIVPQWEAAGADTIRVHIIWKGTPATPTSKDDVVVVDSRKFRFTLIEIVS